MKQYQVVVTHEDGKLLANVPELEGTHTFAANWSALDLAVREAVTVALVEDDKPAPDFIFAYDMRLPSKILDAVEQSRRLSEAGDPGAGTPVRHRSTS